MSACVLVIDDSPTVRKILETCLRRAGYEVTSFPDGVTALHWLLTPSVRLPNLLLLDIEMPGMDGYAVAQYLKARPQYRHIPIVMLSGRRGVLDRLKGRLAGAEHYLTKPFRTQTLLETVQEHLAPASFGDERLMEMDARGIRGDDEQHSLERMSIYG
jgi:twitching motility two-component system response regulator PilG